MLVPILLYIALLVIVPIIITLWLHRAQRTLSDNWTIFIAVGVTVVVLVAAMIPLLFVAKLVANLPATPEGCIDCEGIPLFGGWVITSTLSPFVTVFISIAVLRRLGRK